MLLLGVLGLAFAGGETKAKKNITVRRTRQAIKRKRKKQRSSSDSPSSHGNHMYVPSQNQHTSTQDYTVPVHRGHYDRSLPRRVSKTNTGTAQRKSGLTTHRRYYDAATWSDTTRTSTINSQRDGTPASTTVRQNIPTDSSNRRAREDHSTTSRNRAERTTSSTVGQNNPTDSFTRSTRERRTSSTTQDRSYPL